MTSALPTFETIRLGLQGAVATVTLNRPQRLNAAPPQMFAELHAALKLLPGLGARALLITGEGRAFCSGADLQDMGGRGKEVSRGALAYEALTQTYSPALQALAQRRGRQQDFRRAGECFVKGFGAFVRSFLEDVAQPVGFVKDDQVPVDGFQIGAFVGGEFVGRNEDSVGIERIQPVGFFRLIVISGLDDFAGQGKLAGQFLLPLFAQRSWDNQQNAPLFFRPTLGDDQRGFDGFSQADFIGQDYALGHWRTQREHGGIHLMRVQINFGGGNRTRKFVGGIPVQRQQVRQILALEKSISGHEFFPLVEDC